jgi:mannobiose 2-epimerase
MAGSAYGFMRKHLLDPKTSLFYYSVSRDGRTVEKGDAVLYALWFSIYGAAAYGSTFSDAGAKGVAMACFQAIDRTWHNATTGGYNELLSNNIPGGNRPYDSATTPDKLIPSTLNAILHGIEALTELYKARPNDLVQNRLLELLHILCIKMVTAEGILYSEYTPGVGDQQWKPTPRAVVNYGHLIETSWLIYETLDVLQAAKVINPVILAAYQGKMIHLGARTVELGYDHKHGGFYDEGLPGRAPRSDKKIWWSQAEGALGLWNLYVHTKDPRYLHKVIQTVAFMRDFLNDSKYGEFLWQVEANGTSNINDWPGVKGNMWKASYHSLRMLVLLPRRIRAGI